MRVVDYSVCVFHSSFRKRKYQTLGWNKEGKLVENVKRNEISLDERIVCVYGGRGSHCRIRRTASLKNSFLNLWSPQLVIFIRTSVCNVYWKRNNGEPTWRRLFRRIYSNHFNSTNSRISQYSIIVSFQFENLFIPFWNNSMHTQAHNKSIYTKTKNDAEIGKINNWNKGERRRKKMKNHCNSIILIKCSYEVF